MKSSILRQMKNRLDLLDNKRGMSFLRHLVPTLTVLILLSGCADVFHLFQDVRPFHLTLAHVNDTHTHLEPTTVKLELGADSGEVLVQAGEISRVVTKINKLRSEAENMLFLHAGDMNQGTIYAHLYHGQADTYFFEQMGLDAMVTGNHEYDNGLARLQEFIGQADFPILAANVEIADKTLLDEPLQPYVIKEFGNEKIGIIGLVTSDVPSLASPDININFLDELTVAQSFIDKLEKQGINKIILLTHVGYEKDIEFARKLTGADIIVGGHSHTLLGDMERLGLHPEGEYPTVVRSGSGETVLVVQAWQFDLVIGILDVYFNDKGQIRSYTGRPVMVLSDILLDHEQKPLSAEIYKRVRKTIEADPVLEIVPRDKQSAKRLADYMEGTRSYREKIVGKSAQYLKHVRVPNISLPGGSMLAPVVCDAMLWKAHDLGIPAHGALQNGGGVRVDLDKGPVSVAEIYTILPFQNTLVVLEITGNDLKMALESSIAAAFAPGSSGGSFPYVAGFSYQFKKDNPKGERLKVFNVRQQDGSWQPVEMDKVYTVVANSYISKGKDGYEPLLNSRSSVDTGHLDADVFMQYLQEKKVISPGEERIRLY